MINKTSFLGRFVMLDFNEREIYMSSPVRLSSVTFVHHTKAIEIFRNVSPRLVT